jgi:RHS repeat-associated protein
MPAKISALDYACFPLDYACFLRASLAFAQALYGSTQGRFTSPDPFSASAIIADPQTFNRYAYCRNNPVNSVDPSGMSAYAATRSSEGAAERRQASWQSGH